MRGAHAVRPYKPPKQIDSALTLRQHQPVGDHGGEDEGEVPKGEEEELAGEAFARSAVEPDGVGDEDAVQDQGADQVDPAQTEGDEEEGDGGEEDRVEEDLTAGFALAGDDGEHGDGGAAVFALLEEGE